MHYSIQWIKFHHHSKPISIVLQYVNGPCPLIALCNVLFLRGKLTLPSATRQVSFEDLCALIRNYLQISVQAIALRDEDEARIANTLQSLEDSLKIIPKIEQGLDINVKFSDPLAYEFTSELSLFDLCGVRMVHGWCYDAQDESTQRVIGSMSYNELVNFLTSDFIPNETDSDEVKSNKLMNHLADQAIAQSFLRDTSSQLSIAGLAALHQVLRDEELAVLFRNNHFSVVLKHNTRLYSLVSDSEFIAAAPYIVWAYLSDVQGDQLFLDHDFKIPHPDTVAYYARLNQRPSPPAAAISQHPPTPAQPAQQPTIVHATPIGGASISPQPPQPQPQLAQLQPPSAPPAENEPATVPAAALEPVQPAQAAAPSSAAVAPSSSSASSVVVSSGSSSSSLLGAYGTPLSAREAQELFAAQNGMRWNEGTQNYEPLPQQQQQQPTARQYQQQQIYDRQRIEQRMAEMEINEQKKHKRKKSSDSCAIQ